MPPTTRRFRSAWFKPWVRLDLLVWAFILAAGFHWIISYQMKAGESAPLLPRWPAGVNLPFDSHRYNLVMFAHPKCPCTRASLSELEIVLAQGRGEIDATVCFIDPEDAPGDWADTSLEREAKAIPGVNVVLDRDESIAKSFGAMTSGQVVMFDRAGRGVFSGGITGARGHAGENLGRNLVLAFADGSGSRPAQTPVYGCALHDAVVAEADSR